MKKTWIITLISIPFIIVYFGMYTLFSISYLNNHPITNSKYYSKIYYSKIMGFSFILREFPTKIPKQATDAYFYDDLNSYILYYVDKDMTKNKMDNKYKKKTIWTGKIYDNDKKVCLKYQPFSNTPVSSIKEKDFTIYLIDCDENGNVTHYTFVAYNEKTHEIIYKTNQF